MASIHNTNAKPKLGHAAALFSDAPGATANRSTYSAGKSPVKVKWLAGVVVALLAIAIFTLQAANMQPYAVAETISSPEPETPVNVVLNDNGNSQLVGALIHNDEERQLDHKLIAHPTQPILLNKQERERLLQIISN